LVTSKLIIYAVWTSLDITTFMENTSI